MKNVITYQTTGGLRGRGEVSRSESEDGMASYGLKIPSNKNINYAPPILFVVDAEGVIKFVRGKWLSGMGWSQAELVGTSIYEFFSENKDIFHHFESAFDGHENKFQLFVKQKAYVFRLIPLTFVGDSVTELVGIVNDVGVLDRLKKDSRGRGLADPITNLPGRDMLLDYLSEMIVSGTEPMFALVVINLNGFHEINNTFGFRYGDYVLRQVGSRLRQEFQDNGFVARIAGDEFGIMIPGQNIEELANITVISVLSVFETPFYIDNNAIDLDAGVGIAFFPEHGDKGDLLLRRAATTMQSSKKEGRRHGIYVPTQDDVHITNLVMLAELRQAIDNGHLLLYYQPKLDLLSGNFVGVEALLRWDHPRKGLITPGEFIGLVERTSAIRTLTQWVMNTVARQQLKWRELGFSVSVAINVSSRVFRSDDLFQQLESLMVSGIDASQIELEISEEALMNDPHDSESKCRTIREMGLSLAIDDFGVGHSPLACLKKLDATHIKIDRTLIKDMLDNPDSLAMVRAVVALGEQLDLITVAEGVEDRATFETLAQCGCKQGQGYYIAQPMSADDLVQWKTRHQA